MNTVTFLYGVIVAYIIFTALSMFKISKKIELENLRGNKMALWSILIFSILFLISYFSIFSIFFGSLYGLELIAKPDAEAKIVSSWLGEFSYQQMSVMFIFIFFGILGLKAVPLIIELAKKLLNTSLVLTPKGEIRYKEKL